MTNDKCQINVEDNYNVELDVYKGPFDLLLKAIDDGEINVHQVSLSQIVKSYFEYWKREAPPLVAASDFIFMAAYLLELKTKSILPKREDILGDELLDGVEDSLVSHIQEYEAFKNLAQTLKERKNVFSRVYGRHEGERQEREFELKDVSLRDLVSAFQRVYNEATERENVFHIAAEEVTLEDRVAEIRQMLACKSRGVAFEDIFIRKTRIEIVVTFLAILELAKLNSIRITQGGRFGSIMIMPKTQKEEVEIGQA
ncbi:MAG: segregation/condensation protein A [Candidatus Margulisiibacteriota bacterium]|nr:segregation/condensation protein A [Candidatus Margulisiibacteriota bacterium]